MGEVEVVRTNEVLGELLGDQEIIRGEYNENLTRSLGGRGAVGYLTALSEAYTTRRLDCAVFAASRTSASWTFCS